MIPIKKYFTAVCLLAGVAEFVQASGQAYVDAGEVGQGFLVKRLDTCYLVTPAHVVGDSLFANITTNSTVRSLGEGVLVETFGYDLSLLSIAGAAGEKCSTTLSQLDPGEMNEVELTTVRVSSVNADGSQSFVPVDITDIGLQYLRVRSRETNRSLYKGLSGSLVTSGKRTLGVLQSVDSETGEGIVLRMDRVVDTLQPFFRTNAMTNQLIAGVIPAVAEPTSVSISAIPLAWSEHAIDAQHRLGNLFDGDPETEWASPFQTIPYIIEAQVGEGDAVTIKSIVLALGAATRQAVGAQPKDFEIQVTRRASGNRGWSSVYGGTWLKSEWEKVVSMAPVKAKRIRVILYSNWGADTVRISEIILR